MNKALGIRGEELIDFKSGKNRLIALGAARTPLREIPQSTSIGAPKLEKSSTKINTDFVDLTEDDAPEPMPASSRMKSPVRTEEPDAISNLDKICESREGKTVSNDDNYSSLPDYCPPLSTLPTGGSKTLKTNWTSNNPFNLADDPDRHMLHEAEIVLASTLRLTCATYLCSKRRIFEGRLKAYKNGKDFKRIDVQQACKIGVNKASKLWTVYDKVGWFNRAYFEQYL